MTASLSSQNSYDDIVGQEKDGHLILLALPVQPYPALCPPHLIINILNIDE